MEVVFGERHRAAAQASVHTREERFKDAGLSGVVLADQDGSAVKLKNEFVDAAKIFDREGLEEHWVSSWLIMAWPCYNCSGLTLSPRTAGNIVTFTGFDNIEPPYRGAKRITKRSISRLAQSNVDQLFIFLIIEMWLRLSVDVSECEINSGTDSLLSFGNLMLPKSLCRTAHDQ
jgi:hypothetical protein